MFPQYGCIEYYDRRFIFYFCTIITAEFGIRIQPHKKLHPRDAQTDVSATTARVLRIDRHRPLPSHEPPNMLAGQTFPMAAPLHLSACSLSRFWPSACKPRVYSVLRRVHALLVQHPILSCGLSQHSSRKHLPRLS